MTDASSHLKRGRNAAFPRAKDGAGNSYCDRDRRSTAFRIAQCTQPGTTDPCYTLCARCKVEGTEARSSQELLRPQEKNEPASVSALRARDQQAFERTVPVCGV